MHNKAMKLVILIITVAIAFNENFVIFIILL